MVHFPELSLKSLLIILIFRYDTCYGSIGDSVKTESGCILAHCMGLGKTLQLITLVHTLIMNKELNTKRVIVICPKSTIMNWCEEFQKWLKNIKSNDLKVWFFEDQKSVAERVKILDEWYKSERPFVLLINYEALRYLVHFNGGTRAKVTMPEHEVARLREIIDRCLLSPGADLVVADEGHLIKNPAGKTNTAITKIGTKRRIILTGTPVQNNLNEYYAMVNWIKPAFLGTVKEFNNLYANPIKEGQHADSTTQDIKKMKQRSFILYKKLSQFVQRKEAMVLKEFLPEKREYVIFVPLTTVQEDLYRFYLSSNRRTSGQKLLNDYTALRKIWTHAKVLQNAWERAMRGELKIIEPKQAKNSIDDDLEGPDDLHDNFEGDTGVKSDWWRQFVSSDDLESLFTSNKMVLLFEILNQCHIKKEKVLIFSAFVAVLNVVEYFMKKINNSSMQPSYTEGLDYYRLDGSTKRDARHSMIQRFNDRENTRLRVFLISAKAGGQGINLTGELIQTFVEIYLKLLPS